VSYVAAEIDSQPDAWRRAGDLAGSVADLLPKAGARVAVVGCGTSLYMAQCFAALREAAEHGETDAFPASEFPRSRSYDHVVAVTRSGTTTEVVRLLEGLPAGRPSTAITTDPAAPAARLATAAVTLDFADERSVVQTRFATSALALWRSHLDADLEPAIGAASAELVRDLDAEWVAAERFTFLGCGWTVGLAHEAALKLREASRSWAESYPAMEFRHGPISVVDARSVVWLFGPPPAGLLDDIRATGAHVVQADLDPMALLVRAQRLAVAIAERRGLDPDAPRNLTRSIVLDA
jgi:fructoselysine-6-P-deglycase FrlB-like protein